VRTVFLGTSDFAATVLGRLAGSEHRPALVVTRPDAPRGRGRKLTPPPVAITARELGIELLQPERLHDEDVLARIAAAAPEVLLVCAYGALIRDPLLGDYEVLNVHPSLLPRWRGAAPIERAIMAGDEHTGVSIIRLTAELDAGPVCLQDTVPIGPDDDYGTLAARLQQLGGHLLVRSFDEMLPFREQPSEGVTYAEKIGPEDRRLDPALGAAALERRVRALNPHIGAYVDEPRLSVRRARVSDDDVPPGELAARDGRLLYGTADGALDLIEVVPAGSRPMDAAAYLRGHGVG
jgi:methionyl-tRNA formyltransferase